MYKLPELGIRKFSLKFIKQKEKIIIDIVHYSQKDIRCQELIDFLKMN